MTIRILIDRNICDGFGNCVHAAQDLFALGEDGIAVALHPDVGTEKREALQRAVYDCPTNAISIAEA